MRSKEAKLLVEAIRANPDVGLNVYPVPKYLEKLVRLGYIRYVPRRMSDYRTLIAATPRGRMRILDPEMLYVSEVMEG